MKLQIDTEQDAIILNGKTISLEFLNWFLHQPKGTIIEWMGPDSVSGNQTFRDVTRLVTFADFPLRS